jgi:hypothetical protein
MKRLYVSRMCHGLLEVKVVNKRTAFEMEGALLNSASADLMKVEQAKGCTFLVRVSLWLHHRGSDAGSL